LLNYLAVSIVDLTLIVLLSLFAVRGYFRGLFLEVLSIVGIFTGFIAALQYNDRVALLAQAYWAAPPLLLKTVGFFMLFFAIYFIFNLVGWLFQRWARFLFLAGFNRVGGVLVGAGKGAAFLALILFFLGSASFMPKAMKQRVDDAYLVPPLNRFGQELVQIGKDRLFSQKSGKANEKKAQSQKKWA